MSDTKILVSIPTTGTMKTATALSVIEALKNCEHEYNVIAPSSCLIHMNRNVTADKAIEGGYSHVMFIDSDMVVSHDVINKLVMRDVDIVGVGCSFRNSSKTPNYKPKEGEHEGVLVPVEHIGTAVMLIKTDVFYRMDRPFFEYPHNEKGQLLAGSDVYFCHKARDFGCEVFMDKTLKAGHIGDFVYLLD